MGMGFLFTTRGIPQLYYGTELLMDRSGASHADVRLDFPGGWAGDKVNAFTKEGRITKQNEAVDYIKMLANWRKTKPVVHAGKLMQFIPEDNIYVYFRYNDAETVMVVMNGNTSAKKLPTARFAERTKGFKTAKDVVSGQTLNDLSVINIPAQSTLILEMEK
jgi:glycosidase